jgi:hypothetical protein
MMKRLLATLTLLLSVIPFVAIALSVEECRTTAEMGKLLAIQRLQLGMEMEEMIRYLMEDVGLTSFQTTFLVSNVWVFGEQKTPEQLYYHMMNQCMSD